MFTLTINVNQRLYAGVNKTVMYTLPHCNEQDDSDLYLTNKCKKTAVLTATHID